MIKSILVPVDGSKHSGKALMLAVDIAEKYAADLSVLFVVSHEIDEELSHFTNTEYNLKDDSAINTASEQMGKSMVNRMINNLKTNVVVKNVVLFGNPAARIVEYSMNNNFDMLVMGNRGLSDIKGIMMGSVSRKVRKLVECTFVSIK